MKSIQLIAPAKVNLYLGIGRKRADGYHDATTVMHALAMHDVLTMTRLGAGERTTLFEPCDAAQPLRQFEAAVDPDSGLAVSANIVWREGIEGAEISDEDNLACRAVRALAQELGRREDELVRIVVEKHIPHQSGLGGGSADAAAALVGAAELWGVSADDPVLARVAQELGADVRFFLHGGCALLSGRGDELVRYLVPRRDSVAIIRPEGGISTREAYAAFDEDPQPPTEEELLAVTKNENAEMVPLENNLVSPAERILPELAEVRRFTASFPGVKDTILCGSGSATLAVCQDFKTAQAVSAHAQKRGWWARTSSFTGVRAALLPSRK